MDAGTGVLEAKDICYTASGHEKHALDVYYPADAMSRGEALPVLFFVRCGGRASPTLFLWLSGATRRCTEAGGSGAIGNIVRVS